MRKISGEWLCSCLDCVDYSVYIFQTHQIVHVEFIVYQLQHKKNLLSEKEHMVAPTLIAFPVLLSLGGYP